MGLWLCSVGAPTPASEERGGCSRRVRGTCGAGPAPTPAGGTDRTGVRPGSTRVQPGQGHQHDSGSEESLGLPVSDPTLTTGPGGSPPAGIQCKIPARFLRNSGFRGSFLSFQYGKNNNNYRLPEVQPSREAFQMVKQNLK